MQILLGMLTPGKIEYVYFKEREVSDGTIGTCKADLDKLSEGSRLWCLWQGGCTGLLEKEAVIHRRLQGSL